MEWDDKNLVCMALDFWINFISTGDITISQEDAVNLKKPLKPLSVEQMKLIVRISELKDRIATTGKI